MKSSPEKLHFTIEGTGPKLVLIHGFLETNHMWEPLRLEENFTCIKIELPGHGLSQNKNTKQTIEFMAECVYFTLNSITMSAFDIIGHSLGGYVALQYAKRFGISGKLILLHSNFWEDDAKKKIDRQRIANIVLKNKNLFLNEAIPALFLEPKKYFVTINNLILEAKKMSAEAIADASLSMQKRKDHRDTLNKYSTEISIVQGEFDRLVPKKTMLDSLKGLKNKIVVIPNAGHMGHLENTESVQKAIIELLKTKNGHF